MPPKAHGPAEMWPVISTIGVEILRQSDGPLEEYLHLREAGISSPSWTSAWAADLPTYALSV